MAALDAVPAPSADGVVAAADEAAPDAPRSKGVEESWCLRKTSSWCLRKTSFTAVRNSWNTNTTWVFERVCL